MNTMLRNLILCAGTFTATTLSAVKPTVTWETLGNTVNAQGKQVYHERYTVTEHKYVARIAFNKFKRPMKALNQADTVAEIIPGYFYLASPRFSSGSDTVVIDVETQGTLTQEVYGPDGVHAVMRDGSVMPVEFTLTSMIRSPEQWSTPDTDLMPYGDDIYRFNATLTAPQKPLGPYETIPSFKRVTETGDGGFCSLDNKAVYRAVNNENPEYYRIDLSGDAPVIEYASPRARTTAARVLYNRLARINGNRLPHAVIEDWPDLPYRAVMIDIVRNYTTPENMKKVVKLLADYRFNTLHFHITDDEGWRLEIPGLPELTTVGSRRGYTLDDSEFLAQVYSGDGNPDSHAGISNGQFTRDEFIDLLRECDALGIDVIPEIESPGHARAAIKSMEARARKGDASYRLIDPADTSVYTTAQDYHDNTMNPAAPGVYRFMTKVIDEIAAMYKDAGVKLKGIHIGGDEVAKHAWDGSPMAQALMRKKGLKTQKQLHAEFVLRVADILAERGIPVHGWQDIAVGYSDKYNKTVAPLTGGVNCWTRSTGKTTTRALQAGFPVILSNVNRFYLDQSYNMHPLERGLRWGGTVDEFTTLGGYPDSMVVVKPEYPGRITGVSGQLFNETLRSYPMLEEFLLPKMLGLAERGWNNSPTYTDSRYNKIIAERELPSYVTDGHSFHLRQPGILIEEDTVKMNSLYRGAVIRYTLDGTDPDDESPIYTAPFAYTGGPVRARLYMLGKESVTTIARTPKK